MIEVIGGTLAAVLGALVLAWLEMSAQREPDIVDGKTVLRHSRGTRLVFAVGALLTAFLSAVCAWWLLTNDGGAATRIPACMGAVFFLPLSCIAWGEFRVRLEVDEQGTRGRTAFRGVRSIAWGDVTSVVWSQMGNCFVLRDRHGEMLRVSAKLQGVRAWAAMCAREVPEHWRQAMKNHATKNLWR